METPPNHHVRYCLLAWDEQAGRSVVLWEAMDGQVDGSEGLVVGTFLQSVAALINRNIKTNPGGF